MLYGYLVGMAYQVSENGNKISDFLFMRVGKIIDE